MTTESPVDYMFRAVPIGGIAIDLNRPSDSVTFRTSGCTTGTIQINQQTGSSGTWVVTVERANDISKFVAMASDTTYYTSGVQAAITLDTEYTRVRVTTPQGSDATGTITMFARP